MPDLAAVEALEARAHAAEQALLRLEVIEAKALPVSWSRYLRGVTKRELEADADFLIAERKSYRSKVKHQSGPPSRQPREKLRPGRPPVDPIPLNGDGLLDSLRRVLS